MIFLQQVNFWWGKKLMGFGDFPCLKTKNCHGFSKMAKWWQFRLFLQAKVGKWWQLFRVEIAKTAIFGKKLPFRWQFCIGGCGGDPGFSLQCLQKRIIYPFLYSYKRLKTYRISGTENVAGNLGNLYIYNSKTLIS